MWRGCHILNVPQTNYLHFLHKETLQALEVRICYRMLPEVGL
jgi:hypothetical protein